ncbi:uncharacterized protein LOC134661086 [Cydia amplana]|uniref:uncharacterized protein LOC134661086 n=1 Tax=Cydia amplana TaxID=1869771 RepID=UPI002FE66A66
MAGRESPANGGYEAAEPALRVRKDLFAEVRLPKPGDVAADVDADADDSQQDLLEESISCVNLETDFEKSIDEIANQKLQANGALSPPERRHPRSRHRKHKQHSRHNSHSHGEQSPPNGCLPQKKKKKKSRHNHSPTNAVTLHVKGGKNLNLVSSSECQVEQDADEDSSEDEVLKFSVKLPLINVVRQSGKPYSHELSQLSTKKSKSKDFVKERRTHTVTPCSGKPRSMLDICSSKSKKKSKKSDSGPTYHSQIVDTNTIKIKIRRTSVHETVPPTPTSIADIGQSKSKKKRAASPVCSVSSGEEYDPAHPETAAAVSVAAPKPRHPPTKTKKSNSKSKTEKTDKSRVSGSSSKESGPQSGWASSMPEEILVKIFEYIVASQGTLPSVIKLGKVCKLWHAVSLRPELWKQVDLAQYTSETHKTDYRLVSLLENRLSHCQSLNIAQWKVCNVSWVLACLVEYCPNLAELSVAGWSRLTPEQLYDLAQGLPKLQRMDLSLTSETGGSSTCLSAGSMARLAASFGERFTHLTLANNKFTALPQILSSIAAHCPNLEVLDISGARATSHPAAVPLEALQKGCPKMRVFSAANSQLVLASATKSQQMECVGWTMLEELSIAAEAATERLGVGEYRLGDEALARLVRDATRLRLLDLRGLHRLSDSGLVRVPAWDLQHLFLGGCNVTRKSNSCLELICEKWSHSLLELDLSWASAERVLDTAVCALADAPHSKLRTLNLFGSSVSLEPVKKILMRCPELESLNLAACRALPRGMKRLYTGKELQNLKDSYDPAKAKTKEDSDKEDADASSKKDKKCRDDFKSESANTPNRDDDEKSAAKVEAKSPDKSSSSVFQEPKSVSDTTVITDKKLSEVSTKYSPDSKAESSTSKDGVDTPVHTPEGKHSTREPTPKLLSPIVQSKPDSSSTPRSDSAKTDLGSPHFSPVPKPDSQVQNSPEVLSESFKSNSWNLGQFKTTPTHRSEASPLNRLDSHSRVKASKVIEQCSPTTSLENKLSPEIVGAKQDIKNPNSWNYGNYSPMTRQDSQFPSQKSPYSAQPSPAQPSPYSAQPSPYSTQQSPYSSQPSPYSAQPSPDTSQMVKSDIPKSGAWNAGNYSPMPKHHAPFSPHPSTHTSPDPGLGVKSDSLRSNPNKTPGQYSPMSRQDRLHQSPYSPRPSAENVAYNNKKSPGVGGYSPMMRPDCHLPSPDGGQSSRPTIGRTQDVFGRQAAKLSDMMAGGGTEPPGAWGLDRFSQLGNPSMESLVWGAGGSYSAESTHAAPRLDNIPPMLNTPPPQAWPGLPAFTSSARRPNNDMSDPWTLGQFRVEPPHQVHNTFVEQNVSFDSLSAPHALPHLPQSYLGDGFSGSRLE